MSLASVERSNTSTKQIGRVKWFNNKSTRFYNSIK